MVATSGKARKIVQEHLEPDEQLVALINVADGGVGDGLSAHHRATREGAPSHHLHEQGLAERGIRGVPVVGDSWFALTQRRLLVFSGAFMTLRPKPKELLVTLPADEIVSLRWWTTKRHRTCRILHLDLGDDEHVIRYGEIDDDCDAFITALGERAVEVGDP